MTDLSEFDRPSAPPVEPEVVEAEEAQPRWPAVIGTISVIYACLGLLCAVGQIGWLSFAPVLPEMMTGGIDMPTIVKVPSLVLAVIVVALGFTLLAAGIGLARRKPSAVSLMKKWAMARVIVVILGVGVVVLTGPAQVQMQQQSLDFQTRIAEEYDTPPPAKKTDEQLWQTALINAAIFSGIVLIYPVFVILYLSRQKIEAQVREWR